MIPLIKSGEMLRDYIKSNFNKFLDSDEFALMISTKVRNEFLVSRYQGILYLQIDGLYNKRSKYNLDIIFEDMRAGVWKVSISKNDRDFLYNKKYKFLD